MRTLPYSREAAVVFAERWALGRNPAYYNFDELGGDCTNFISQCLYAGCGVMNDTPQLGWYYYSLNSRAPAWTGVEFLHRFLTANKGAGPFAARVRLEQLQPGDVIQLGASDGSFYHSLLVLQGPPDRVFVAAHTDNALWRYLDSYSYHTLRCLHILGARSL